MSNKCGVQWPIKAPLKSLNKKDLCGDCYYFRKGVSVRGWCNEHQARTSAHYDACNEFDKSEVV